MLHEVAQKAVDDPQMADLLLDAPQLMGVESIELDTVNLRMVARTLPGKQFEVGRRLRMLVVRALRRAGIVAPTEVDADGRGDRASRPPQAAPRKRPGPGGRQVKLTLLRRGRGSRGWPSYIFGGRMRTSTAGLLLAFVAFFWLNQHYQPEPTATPGPAQQVVPPGFVPDPDYTWVPRTNVQASAEVRVPPRRRRRRPPSHRRRRTTTRLAG